MTTLYDKFFGCIAASRIGSAMGAVTEGLTRHQIRERFTLVDDLLDYYKEERTTRWHNSREYFHYRGHQRPAGTTEDGIERQKLITRAIVEKNDRITAEDLKKAWIKYIDPSKFGLLIEPCDETPYYWAKAGVPAEVIGMCNEWPGIISITRSIHPIGLMNACDPESAALNARDIARLYQPVQSVGRDYAAAYAAGIAEACRPNATRDTVVEAMYRYGGKPVQDDIEMALKVARKYDNPMDMIDELNSLYVNDGIYMSYCEELVPRGVAMFYAADGDPRAAMICGVNAGRDTDCQTALAAGLAGALRGMKNIPQSWVDTVDKANLANDWSVCNWTIKESVDGIYRAFLNSLQKKRKQIAEVEAQM